ncbi:TolC family protein [Panacibacter ginsenosidivorans]|uniref:TolC family protein n=1 Tax=Panacibacter ginsenosidivorans TaxID=1813871 RepID=A0A5B8VCI6_9BACT|nr:TolC family protein [Panacibacter ginsenosidivorans]QEC69247.1 TolC family protein [Panacibacter ginsenosidivorans]
MKIFFAAITSMSLLCQAAAAQTLKLNDILDSIQQSYPSLKMYDAQIQSLDAAAKGAKSWMAPQVSTGLWMTPYNTNLWKADGAGNTGMGQYMISAEQMFPNKKYNDANEAYMKAMSSVEKENKQATLNELLATAKKNYYGWLIIEKKLSVLAQSEKLLEFMITNAETRYKNGLGKISAYYKAKASLGTIENMRVELENEIAQKRIAINTLMNRAKQTDFSIDTNYAVKDYSSSLFDSTLFYSNRSDIKAIDKNIQLTYLQQNVEKASLKPQFGVRYDHMFGFGGFPMQYTLMGMMKIPMNWSTKMNKANIESLKWKALSFEDQKVSMANEYSGMAYQMQQNIVAKKKQIELFDKNIIPALKKNYESTLLAYEQNTEELFELYDGWETLNNTQLEFLDQLDQLLSMQVDLEKVLEIK